MMAIRPPHPFAESGLLDQHGGLAHAGSGLGLARAPGETTQPLTPGSRSEPPSRAGALAGALGGRYRLEGRLGSGGLGTVWAGYDLVLSRPVAVKTLPGDLAQDERKRRSQRFLDEARAAARLSHPHIVTIYDAGVEARGAYIVMALLHGKDLRRLLDEGWRPSPHEACRIVFRVAQALAYAHEHGVVHGDIKPANIVLTSRLQPVVLDFGQPPRDDDDHAALGSPYYAAPEQFDGHAADARTDIYAVGVLLYELLAGARPHGGRTLDEIQEAVQRGDVTPLSRHRTDLPAGLEAVVNRAMARKAAARFRNADELAHALRRWVRATPEKVFTRKAHAGTPRQKSGGSVWARLGGWLRSLTRRDAAAPAGAGAPEATEPLAERPAAGHGRPT